MSGTTTLNVSSSTITLQGGGSYVIDGSNDTISAGSNVTVSVNGNNDAVSAAAGDTVIATGANEVATFLGGGGTLNLGSAATSATVNGDNAIVWMNGGGGTLTAMGNGDTVTAGGGGSVVTLDGSNDVTGTWAGDSVIVNGSNAGVISSGSAITVNGAGNSARIYGNQDAVTATGAGATIMTQGSLDTVTFQNGGTFQAGSNTTSATLNGNNVIAWLNGTTGTVVANGNLDTLTGGIGANIVLNGASDTASTSALSTVTVNGSYGIVYGLQTTIEADNQDGETTVFGFLNTTCMNSTDQAVLEDGSADTVVGINSGNTLYLGTSLAGAANLGVEVGGAGGTIENVNSSDAVWLLANTSLTVNGAGGTIGLEGSNDSVAASNEAVTAAAGITNVMLTGSGDDLAEQGGVQANVQGINDSVAMSGGNDYVGLLGGGVYNVHDDDAGDLVNLAGNTTAVVSGAGGAIGLVGSDATVTASNETVTALGGVQLATVAGSGDTVYLPEGDTSLTALGNGDSVYSVDGNTVGFSGTSDTVQVNDGQVYLDTQGTSVTVAGDNDTANAATSGDTLGFAGSADTAQITDGQIYLDTAGTAVTVEGDSNTVNTAQSNTVVGFTGVNNTAQVSNGTIFVNNESGPSLTVQGSGDAETTVNAGTVASPVLDDATASDIDAIYNAVLDRDPSAADYVYAQVLLANGGGLDSVMAAVAGSAESQADMASTYAAINQAAPSQAEFNAFADAMSASYGAPLELFSIDPVTGAQTVLADTSTTNLLAELPVLETEANGVNLGLQLADGSQIGFSSTARLADFLYAVSVQQLQATSFVTDNYNLDMQWLNTVDQPLLNEAVSWSEQATQEVAQGVALAAKENAGGWTASVEAPFNQIAAEDNTMASLALKIAAEAPGSRQNMTVTIANVPNDSTTQVTVYAGGGDTIHDVSGGVLQDIEGVLSTVLDIVALASANPYLYYAAAAIDGAEAGQAFSNGQDLSGILSLAQAVSAGITAEVGVPASAASASTAQITAQILNVAAEGVGGIYGVVQSAQNGNALGILAGVLEAAAAGATGIGLDSSPADQVTLNEIAAGLALGAAGASFASDFNNGDLGEGLVDSLNLFLGAASAAYAVDSANQSNLVMNSAAFAVADADAIRTPTLPDFVSIIDEFITAPSSEPSGQSQNNATPLINSTTLHISPIPIFITNGASQASIIPIAYNGTYHDQVVASLAQDLRNLGATVETEVSLQGYAPNPITGLPATARIDLIAQGPGPNGITMGIEVKTGDSPGYTIGQQVTYPQVIAGHAFSNDPAITSFGFQVGQPLPAIPIIQYYDPGPGYPPDLKTLTP